MEWFGGSVRKERNGNMERRNVSLKEVGEVVGGVVEEVMRVKRVVREEESVKDGKGVERDVGMWVDEGGE